VRRREKGERGDGRRREKLEVVRRETGERRVRHECGRDKGERRVRHECRRKKKGERRRR
jgi:hypothetical protein